MNYNVLKNIRVGNTYTYEQLLSFEHDLYRQGKRCPLIIRQDFALLLTPEVIYEFELTDEEDYLTSMMWVQKDSSEYQIKRQLVDTILNKDFKVNL